MLFRSLVNEQDVTGRTVDVEGPLGDFWLRPGAAPLLFVAGGSGLAPILAILEEAAARGVDRPATLLFGAREKKDLYALERIEAIARRWRGPFRFVPVLSAEAEGSAWTGERGYVAEKIPSLLEAGADAYLCGPPAMIDGAVALLRSCGAPAERIRFDRFTASPSADADAIPAMDAAADPAAGPLDYLKFFLFHFEIGRAHV